MAEHNTIISDISKLVRFFSFSTIRTTLSSRCIGVFPYIEIERPALTIVPIAYDRM